LGTITKQSIKKKLTEQISLSLGEEIENIRSDMLLHDLGLDSLGLVELFVFIENEFAIKLMESGISQQDIMRIDSLSESIHKALNN
jgi:acyl carrier protein